MRIVIYTGDFSKNSPNENEQFIIRLFDRIVHLYPGPEFIFISTKTAGEKIITRKNIIQLTTAPISTNTLVWKWWLNIKLPSLLKRYNADVFIGNNFCSLKTEIPQCLLITDPLIFSQPGYANRKQDAFYKRNLLNFFQRAKSTVCFSVFVKNEIIKNYGKNFNDLKLVLPAVDETFKPLNDIDKNRVKENLTGRAEYFIYTGDLDAEKNLFDLLKAFSVFKKMQQSNMKLVFAGKIVPTYKNFLVDLKTYKHRNDVLIIESISQQGLAEILGAAYASVLPSHDILGVQVLRSIQCDVPVISAKGSATQEIAKDAALYFNAGDHSDLAAQMMYLFKDEDMRKSLIEKGKVTRTNYSMDNSAKLLWQVIEEALK